MQKIGSNLAEILDPCIEKFLKTEAYLEVCTEFELEDEECIPNSFFDPRDPTPWN